MATWDLFQRMLQTPANELYKIEAAIKSRYQSNCEASELYDVIKDWCKDSNNLVWSQDTNIIDNEDLTEDLEKAGVE